MCYFIEKKRVKAQKMLPHPFKPQSVIWFAIRELGLLDVV
jgi:hypothetical protein